MEKKHFACIGAGLIGQGWATVFASRGREVIIQDLNEATLKEALERIASNLRFLEVQGFIQPGEAIHALKRIRTTVDVAEALAGAEYVQESVPDSYPLKREIFSEMDRVASPDVILASSASGLLMSEIQDVTEHPDRCVLAHPLLPVHLIPLVEIAGGRLTSERVVNATREIMSDLGKRPVVLKKEVHGYIVNRLQAAILREAIDLVDSGVASTEDVDTAFCSGIGLRDPFLGPFLKIHVGARDAEQFLERYSQSYQYRWESMVTWTSVPPSAKKAVVRGVKDMEIVRTRSSEELKHRRDHMLARILHMLQEEDEGSY